MLLKKGTLDRPVLCTKRYFLIMLIALDLEKVLKLLITFFFGLFIRLLLLDVIEPLYWKYLLFGF
jgi:hypothetical protein